MAQWTVDKSYTYDKDSTVTATKDIDVDKKVDIKVSGDLPAEGGLNVEGDVVFKELDVEVQDEEVVSKFFELDDSASSKWTVDGKGVLNAAEQLQNGLDNQATIVQAPQVPGVNEMNVGLQYQIGNNNLASITQGRIPPPGGNDTGTNSFAKQIQFGDINTAGVVQH
jgi:hypothetical protein